MRTVVAIFLVIVIPKTSAEEPLSQFRGPLGNGHSEASHVPAEWDEATNIRWKASIPGRAWSSPVCNESMIWMTTAEVFEFSDEEQEAIRNEIYEDHPLGKQLVIVDKVRFRAVAIDAQSAEKIHDVALFTVDRPAAIHSLNSYASPTPVLVDGKLLCHFGSLGTVCLDTRTQSIVWQAQLPHTESVGPGSSPVVHNGLLIVPCDGIDLQYVVALDIETGEEQWKTDRPALQGDEPEYHKAFSTGVVISSEEREQVVIVGAQWVVAYEPATGAEIWRCSIGKGFSVSSRPVYGNGLIYLCTGFGDGRLMAIDPSGNGDVTQTHVKWEYSSQVPTMPSPILVGSEVYLVSDNGIATCLDALSGEKHWRERLGGNYCASPIYVAGNLYFGNREGQTTVVAAGSTYHELSKNELDGEIMASPVVLGEDLLIRTDSHLYRISDR